MITEEKKSFTRWMKKNCETERNKPVNAFESSQKIEQKKVSSKNKTQNLKEFFNCQTSFKIKQTSRR